MAIILHKIQFYEPIVFNPAKHDAFLDHDPMCFAGDPLGELQIYKK
jgi:hypothetical protein